MARAKTGDRPAFESLVRRYEQPLFNYLRRMTGNTAEAEDLFQETFLRVFRHLDRFREGARFRPWLYRIATNVARDRMRYYGRRPQVSLDRPVYADSDNETALDRVRDRAAGPREEAAARETAERLDRAVAALPAKHRAVFLMARYDGLPYEEIAQALRIPVGTVKSRMSKAVNVLLAAMKESTP